MKKVIRLTERDLNRIVKRVISEQEGQEPTYKLSPEEEKEKKIYNYKYKLENLKKNISSVAEVSKEIINDMIKQMGDIENFNKSGEPLDIDSSEKALAEFFQSVLNIHVGETFEYPNEVKWRGMTFNGKIDK